MEFIPFVELSLSAGCSYLLRVILQLALLGVGDEVQPAGGDDAPTFSPPPPPPPPHRKGHGLSQLMKKESIVAED